MPDVPSSSLPVDEAASPLALAVRRVLRPLVRLLLSHRLGYPWLCDVLREIYVEVAEQDFPLDGKPQTDSRISLLTGVHRKSVHELRSSEAGKAEPTPPAITLGTQLVARWVSDPDYVGEDGAPVPLPRLARQGGEVSFEGLVASVSKDIRARAVLDEWLRLGVVRQDGDLVVLNTEAFVPAQGFAEKVFFFGRNVHDHLAAATSNVIGGSPPFLERSVHYDGLRPESVIALTTGAEESSMRTLKEINRLATRLARADAGHPDATRRINVGVYLYSEATADGNATQAPPNGEAG
jgi:hypothetical protein